MAQFKPCLNGVRGTLNGGSSRRRGRILLRVAELVRRDRGRLAEMEALDSAKPIGRPARTSPKSL
jgi:acyl-CoA reductase-like NAD-dependent aldehyde dehydrogenase